MGLTLKMRLKRFVKENGAPPPCLGMYRAGDPECDSPPPCAWRAACRTLQGYANRIGVTIEKLHAETHPRTLGYLALDLTGTAPVYGPSLQNGRSVHGWERFREAFLDAAPSGIVLQASREIAEVGELWVDTWVDNHGRTDRFRARALRVKGTAEKISDVTIVRYFPGNVRFVEPTIEFRADLGIVLDTFPNVRLYANRWSAGGPQGRKPPPGSKYGRAILGMSARQVASERIEDIARLIVRCLERGLIRGVKIKGRRFEVNPDVKRTLDGLPWNG